MWSNARQCIPVVATVSHEPRGESQWLDESVCTVFARRKCTVDEFTERRFERGLSQLFPSHRLISTGQGAPRRDLTPLHFWVASFAPGWLLGKSDPVPATWHFYKCGSGVAGYERKKRRWLRESGKAHQVCDQCTSLSPTGLTARVPRHQSPQDCLNFK